MKINIAIDGPSAAGKSTIADILAQRLGYIHLDTGAMYRSVAYKAKLNNIDYSDEDAISSMIEEMELIMKDDGRVILDNEDISEKIRANDISVGASCVSKLNKCRIALVAMQQKICKDGGYILDGRDIGTVVLKDAPVKIFMVASAEKRAQRRVEQNIQKGIEGIDYQTILNEIKERDYQDTHREFSPLQKAEDAIEIDTSDLTIDEVVDRLLKIIEERLGE